MRATDIIRQVLNMIDSIEANSQQSQTAVAEPEVSVEIEAGSDEELARMKQIAGLLSSGTTQYNNEPQERIADISAVTTDAGGGINGPKNPADLMTPSVSMYPNYQHNPN